MTTRVLESNVDSRMAVGDPCWRWLGWSYKMCWTPNIASSTATGSVSGVQPLVHCRKPAIVDVGVADVKFIRGHSSMPFVHFVSTNA